MRILISFLLDTIFKNWKFSCLMYIVTREIRIGGARSKAFSAREGRGSLRCETVPPRARLSRIVRNRRTVGAGGGNRVGYHSQFYQSPHRLGSLSPSFFLSLRRDPLRFLNPLEANSVHGRRISAAPRGDLPLSSPSPAMDRSKKNPSRVERIYFLLFFAKIYPIFCCLLISTFL